MGSRAIVGGFVLLGIIWAIVAGFMPRRKHDPSTEEYDFDDGD